MTRHRRGRIRQRGAHGEPRTAKATATPYTPNRSAARSRCHTPISRLDSPYSQLAGRVTSAVKRTHPARPRGHAAVDGKVRTRHPPGFVGSQVSGAPGDIVRLAEPAEQGAGGDRIRERPARGTSGG